MTSYYKIVLFIRFLGYFTFILGLITFMAILGPLLQAEFAFRFDKLFGIKHTLPRVVTSDPSALENPGGPGNFGGVSAGEVITPESTEFGIVIEKINANAKVVANVNPASEKDYIQALTQGVAHAAGTAFPGEKGNVYLFSHSTDAPWNIIRYNAIFYLLRELQPEDRVIVFYQNRRYDYIVYDKNIVEPSDITYLTNTYDQSVLTLQTCDPPGTLFKRLVIRAKLASS